MFWPDHLLKWSTSSCFLPLVFQPFTLYFSCARYIRLCAATNLARCRPLPLAQTKQKLGNRGRKWDGPSAGFVWDENRAMTWLAGAPRLKKKKKRPLPFFFLKALLTGLRVTVAGVRRCGEGAGGSTRTAQSLWVVSVHEAPWITATQRGNSVGCGGLNKCLLFF